MRRFVFAALVVSSSALAQEPAESDPTEPVVQYAAQTLMDFETVEVGGTLVKPTIVWNQELTRKKFAPMIQVRRSFDSEVLSSVDDVK